ncbi:hypothetical protein PN836_002880 [Ningiella sp. W23]|uniref:hypothetical protein n=1 Tax=Ningiella sp. W23 TaxID=3023715 RepID=UPI00375668D1
MCLYRYSDYKFNASLFNLGILRVGTLYDFRRAEHEKGIQDDLEGKKTLTKMVPSWNEIQNTRKSSIISPEGQKVDVYLHEGPGGQTYGAFKTGGCKLSNLSVKREINSKDCFVLCFSWHNSSDVSNCLGGANSCLRIDDTNSFINEVTIALNTCIPVYFLGLKKVIYKSRIEVWNSRNLGTNPLFIKDKSFEEQKEVRAIWLPKISANFARVNLKINPVVLANKNLGKFCSLSSSLFKIYNQRL